MYKTVGCEGGLKFSEIVTKNVREDELNPIFVDTVVKLEKR